VGSYCIEGTNFYVLPESSGSAICKVVLTTSAVNVIKVDGYNSSEISLSGSKISTNNTYKKLAILNCDSNTCTRTTGIVKGSTDGYYKIFDGESGTNESYDVVNHACGANNIGGLGKEIIQNVETNVLCLSATKFVPLVVGEDHTTKYIMEIEKGQTSVEGSPFHLSVSENKVVSVGTNFFILDNLLTGKTNFFIVYFIALFILINYFYLYFI